MDSKWLDENLSEVLEMSTEIGPTSPWRWGTRRTYLFEHEGKHYRFVAEFHSEEGLQGIYDGPTEVKQVERTVLAVLEWVPA